MTYQPCMADPALHGRPSLHDQPSPVCASVREQHGAGCMAPALWETGQRRHNCTLAQPCLHVLTLGVLPSTHTFSAMPAHSQPHVSTRCLLPGAGCAAAEPRHASQDPAKHVVRGRGALPLLGLCRPCSLAGHLSWIGAAWIVADVATCG